MPPILPAEQGFGLHRCDERREMTAIDPPAVDATDLDQAHLVFRGEGEVDGDHTQTSLFEEPPGAGPGGGEDDIWSLSIG